MRTRRRLARAPAALFAALLAAGAAGAPAGGFDAYMHTRWNVEEGAPPAIRAIAQTADGWLWLGTADGLFRFDGLRFERHPLPPRVGIGGERIDALHAAANGNLYIGHGGAGISVLHPDGRVEQLPAAPAAPGETGGAIAVDPDGTIWTLAGALRRLRDGAWRTVAEGPDWGGARRRALLLDGRGQLWAGNERGAWRLDRAADRLVRVADAGDELLMSPDGRVWAIDGAGALRLLQAGAASRPAGYRHAQGRLAAQFDRDGALWLLACGPGPRLLPDAGARGGARLAACAEAQARKDDAPPLSGARAHAVFEDREGNVWIVTEQGVDRFRRKRFAAAGLPGSGARYSLAADGEGRMWSADSLTGALWRLYPDRPAEAERGRHVSVVASGRNGSLLVGGKRSIQRRSGAGVEEIPLPPGRDGKPADLHMLGILDDGKVLWTATLETGLIGWRDGKWLPRQAFTLPPKIYQSAPGAAPGEMWLATGDGVLVHYRDGALAASDIRALGMASAIFPGPELTVGGSAGFGVLKDGRLRLLRAADPEALRNASGMVTTPDGDRWINASAGLVHVRAADWRRSMDDPSQPLRYELFDQADGYPGQAVIESRWASAASPDGRHLWLLATGGAIRLDTGALRRNPVPPRAAILRLNTDAGAYPAPGPVMLPPGTERFRIDFTAPALRKPERIRFEYRLDGVDAGWQDGGARRSTSYTNIGPGSYTFRVRALNEDGVAGPAEAALLVSVEPTVVQSAWFRALCLAALALLGVALYRWRVRWLSARLAERLRVKTAERERIARTLHDTFLQTVQGLVLRVDAVAASLPPGARARRQLETVLEDAGSAIGEGRDRLQELRAGDAQVLEQVLAETTGRLRAQHEIAIEVEVEGAPRELREGVASDVADVAREAMRNACAHAGARQVRVLLDYGRRALVLRVSDDGKGFPGEVLQAGGRSDHWGMVGMREQAGRLGARLEIGNLPSGGAMVSLAVPAARAYAARQGRART